MISLESASSRKQYCGSDDKSANNKRLQNPRTTPVSCRSEVSLQHINKVAQEQRRVALLRDLWPAINVARAKDGGLTLKQEQHEVLKPLRPGLG